MKDKVLIFWFSKLGPSDWYKGKPVILSSGFSN